MRQQELTLLIPMIVSIFRRHRRRYGARRISEELWDHGIVCSPKRVKIALKKLGATSDPAKIVRAQNHR